MRTQIITLSKNLNGGTDGWVYILIPVKLGEFVGSANVVKLTRGGSAYLDHPPPTTPVHGPGTGPNGVWLFGVNWGSSTGDIIHVPGTANHPGTSMRAVQFYIRWTRVDSQGNPLPTTPIVGLGQPRSQQGARLIPDGPEISCRVETR